MVVLRVSLSLLKLRVFRELGKEALPSGRAEW